MLKNLLKNKRLILASGSSRRQELLTTIGLNFTVQVSDFPEDLNPADFPHFKDFVMETALRKAQDVFSKQQNTSDIVVIGADTVVVFNNQIYGKPKNVQHAIQMLCEFSGKQHDVCTGIALISDKDFKTFFEITKVTFRKLTSDEIDNYVKTGEPMDKAGSYGIQGEGKNFLDNISGSINNVIGLPVEQLYEHLIEFLNKYDSK